MNHNNEFPWYILTGLIIGLLLGFTLTRLMVPLQNQAVSPAELSGADKDFYRAMIAETYLTSSNLTRALSRLELIQDPDPVQALSAQAQRLLAQNASSSQASALAQLAEVLSAIRANSRRIIFTSIVDRVVRTVSSNTASSTHKIFDKTT